MRDVMLYKFGARLTDFTTESVYRWLLERRRIMPEYTLDNMQYDTIDGKKVYTAITPKLTLREK